MKIPKDFMKGKTVDFYKATVLKQGDEMLVNTGGDVFALDPEHAVKEFFNSMTAAELKKKLGTCITESFQFDVSEDDITNLEINGENAASIMKDDAIVAEQRKSVRRIAESEIARHCGIGLPGVSGVERGKSARHGSGGDDCERNADDCHFSQIGMVGNSHIFLL